MGYVKRWDELPEVEVLANNFRVSMAGLKVGINRIRWVHPTGTPEHRHDDAEQVVIVVGGRMKWVIDGEEVILEPGDVAIVPIGVTHSGATIGENATFYEVFAPLRVQNLIGFVGRIF